MTDIPNPPIISKPCRYLRPLIGAAALLSLSALAPVVGAQAGPDSSLRPRILSEVLPSDLPSSDRASVMGQLVVTARVLDDANRQLGDATRQLKLVEAERSRLTSELRVLDADGMTGLTFYGYRSKAPEAWARQDPADSLYREARRALSSEQYGQAATLFRRIRSSYPKSAYAPDAPYWEAFALQRMGGEANQRAALEALAVQLSSYPTAATRGDAVSLRTRIERSLGQSDDSVARALVRRASVSASRDGCPAARDDERIDALSAVVRLDSANAMSTLRKVLARREACTQQLRRTAVWLVASLNRPDAADVLLQVARNDPDSGVREQAVLWLTNMNNDASAHALIGLARAGDGDPAVLQRALYALSRSKSPQAVQALRDVLRDGKVNDDLRTEALRQYMSSEVAIPEAERLSMLSELVASGSGGGERFKSSVLSAVARIGNERARGILVGVALDKASTIALRKYAVSMLAATVTSGRVAVVGGAFSSALSAPVFNGTFYTAQPSTARTGEQIRAQLFDEQRLRDADAAMRAALVQERAAAEQSRALDALRREADAQRRLTDSLRSSVTRLRLVQPEFPSVYTFPPVPPSPGMSTAVPAARLSPYVFSSLIAPVDSAERVARLPAVAKALGSIYDRSSEAEISQSVVRALQQLPSDAGMDQLLAIARKEKNPELRRSIISGLTRSNDPRVLSLLRELVDRD